jgi:hypothetical protein
MVVINSFKTLMNPYWATLFLVSFDMIEEGRHNLKNLGVDSRTVFKWISLRCGLHWSDSGYGALGFESMAMFPEHAYLKHLSDYSLLVWSVSQVTESCGHTSCFEPTQTTGDPPLARLFK